MNCTINLVFTAQVVLKTPLFSRLLELLHMPLVQRIIFFFTCNNCLFLLEGGTSFTIAWIWSIAAFTIYNNRTNIGYSNNYIFYLWFHLTVWVTLDTSEHVCAVCQNSLHCKEESIHDVAPLKSVIISVNKNLSSSYLN